METLVPSCRGLAEARLSKKLLKCHKIFFMAFTYSTEIKEESSVSK